MSQPGNFFFFFCIISSDSEGCQSIKNVFVIWLLVSGMGSSVFRHKSAHWDTPIVVPSALHKDGASLKVNPIVSKGKILCTLALSLSLYL